MQSQVQGRDARKVRLQRIQCEKVCQVSHFCKATRTHGAVQQCITVSIALTEVLTLIFNRVLQGLQVGFQGCIKRCHFCISLQKSAQLCSRSLHMLRHSHFWMNCSSRPVVHRGRSLILGHPDSNASVTCFPAGCPLPQRRNGEYPSYPHRVPVSGRPGSSSRSRCTYRSCRPCAP